MHAVGAMVLLVVALAEGNGIVKSALEEGTFWPPDHMDLLRYTHHLHCDYEHTFKKIPLAFIYNLHCVETKNEATGDIIWSVVVTYDNTVLDIFDVTSCDQEAVVNSVFSPKQDQANVEYERDKTKLPTVSYLKYKTTHGECFARKYKYMNRASSAAFRFDPEMIQCEGVTKDSKLRPWLSYGDVDKFTNCRVNKLPLSEAVVDYSRSKPAWTPTDDSGGGSHEKLLSCTFDTKNNLYKLMCVKGDKENEYFAFVTYGASLLERFTVKSCQEEDIVYSIFPHQETKANPRTRSSVQTIWFSKTDKRCYKREYPVDPNNGFSQEATLEDCPTTPDQWTNPTWGRMAMWRKCQTETRFPQPPAAAEPDSAGFDWGFDRLEVDPWE